jgi:anaerobic ribonucleoside-triphosphate reductase
MDKLKELLEKRLAKERECLNAKHHHEWEELTHRQNHLRETILDVSELNPQIIEFFIKAMR